MVTNDEIIKKKYYNIRKSPMPNYYNNKHVIFQIYAIEEMLNEARADTAKQIFAELDNVKCIICKRKFLITHYKQYEALKNRFKVD
jgi:hypothetical protein